MVLHPVLLGVAIDACGSREPGGCFVGPGFQLEPGVQPFPGFWLHLPLGRGGCGEVWEARTADGHIALKFMRGKNTATATREIRSTEAIRRLWHTNLLRVEHVFLQADYVVIGMELADGSLMDVLDLFINDHGTALPADLTCQYLSQVADGLDFLNAQQHRHDGKIVAFQHGDIKPTNLLLCGETVKIADFGLATPMTYSLEPHGRRGTLEFAAPELFRGQLSDRTDQYALAVTYYLLRTGSLPFTDTPSRFTPAYTRGRPNLGLLSFAERSVITRALSVSPVHRWTSCREMVDRLSEVASDSASGTGQFLGGPTPR
jgi:serine/threonine protein kinase